MNSLKELLESGFGKAECYTDNERKLYGDVNMNCCERILYGANRAYNLGLKKEDMRIASAFGGAWALARFAAQYPAALWFWVCCTPASLKKKPR